MTAEGKTAASQFLALTADYLTGGYRRPHALGFEGDVFLAGPLTGTENGEAGDALNNSPKREADSLEKVAEEVQRCAGCRLCEKRTRSVAGEGVREPLVLVVGEGPGADEDAAGRPFVGKAGQLLDRMLASIGLSRQKNCYIANVVKCRPPQNRDPAPDEIVSCSRFLSRQIALLKPKVIFCAGRIAAQTILHTATGIGSLRGHFEEYSTGGVFNETDRITTGIAAFRIPLLATYHPSALLRNEDLKRPAWEDLKLLRSRLAELDSIYARETAEQP
ncbi:MAG: uracil-DNA glycosylase [Treponema sp.]|jgi:DNA polymerase|nr:uracil-DNA glycosylase [Treponema sp.]